MDERPFLHLDLLSIDPYVLPELKKLTKETFDVDSVIAAAEELRYVSSIKSEVGKMFEAVPEDLLRLLISRVYVGSITTKVKDLFAGLVQKALAQFINEQVNARLKTALQGQAPTVGAAPAVVVPASDPPKEAQEEGAPESDVHTTVDEEEGFRIVRAIVVSDVEYSRVVMRDQKSYCAVLLDDNNRKPLCRLHFNRGQKYLGLFDELKVETRMPLGEVQDIYTHAEPLREAARRYV
jgi:predicted type IV restriction endonuclease